MGYRNGTSTNRPFDEHYCFFIQDFKSGDSLLVKVGRKNVRGVVASVNRKRNVIVWKDSDDSERIASLDDIRYLAPPERGWLIKE